MSVRSRAQVTHLSVVGALTAALSCAAFAQHAGHGSGGDGDKAGGGGKGGKGHSMHAGHHGPAPGDVMEMCKGHEGMPPHYCAPHYHVASSVPGVSITRAEPMGEKSVMVTLKAYPGVQTPRVVIVGGGGSLAGGTTVAAGWKDGATVHLDLAGADSLYTQHKLHLHVFPLTGK